MIIWLIIGCGSKFSLYDETEANEPPVIDSITLSPTDPSAQTEILSCDVEASDPEEDEVTISYLWQLNGTDTSFESTLDGPFVIGDAIACTAIATDSNGNESIPGQVSTLILNSLPNAEIISIGPRPPKTNDTLQVQAEVSDLDADQVLSLSYEWHVIVNGSGTDMMVQTGESPMLDGVYYFDKGDSVYVKVIPNDGESAGEPIESEPLIVANSAPLKPELAIVSIDPSGNINTEPIEGEDLQCLSGELIDPDDDLVVPDIAWKRNGNPWSGMVYDTNYIGDTIDGGDTVGGDIWSCQWTASDPDGAQVASDWVDIEVNSGLVSATCADLVTSMNMWGGPAQGMDLRAWTNSTLHYIGCNGDGCSPTDFFCNDDPTAESIEFGSGGTLRAVVDPNNSNGDIMPTSYSSCCNGPLGLCNSFDQTNNGIGINAAEALCFALGYSSGSILSYVSSNSCPEVHANSLDGLDWGSDFSNSSGYGNKYRCEGYR